MLASRTDCMFCLQVFDICFHEVSTRVALRYTHSSRYDSKPRKFAQEFSIRTVWAFTKACGPKCESSRRYPLFLTPPIGTRGSDAVTQLMKTPPVYKSRAILRARAMSFGPYIAAQSKLACIHRVSCAIMILAQLAPLHSPSERKRYDPSA